MLKEQNKLKQDAIKTLVDTQNEIKNLIAILEKSPSLNITQNSVEIYGHLSIRRYNNQQMWELLGFEGSATQQGNNWYFNGSALNSLNQNRLLLSVDLTGNSLVITLETGYIFNQPELDKDSRISIDHSVSGQITLYFPSEVLGTYAPYTGRPRERNDWKIAAGSKLILKLN